MVSDIWSSFLMIAKEEAGSRVVDTWFKAVSLVEWDAATGTVYLQAPNHFVKDWIKSHYVPLIEMHLKRLLSVDKIKIILTDGTADDEPSPLLTKPPLVFTPTTPAVVSTQEKKIIPAHVTTFKGGSIGRTYTFDSFVVGPNNSLAYAAAQAVTDQPGTIYNPLFIYGHSGLGKTHLLHAIGNKVKKNKKSVTLYQTADRFVTEFINAIRFDKIHAFQQNINRLMFFWLMIFNLFLIKNRHKKLFSISLMHYMMRKNRLFFLQTPIRKIFQD